MEPRSQGVSSDVNVSGAHDHHIDSNLMADPSAACNLCGIIVQSAELEIFSLCGDCKFLLLENLGTPMLHSPRRQTTRRRTRRRRTRHNSSESIGDLPSEQFTRLISVARQSLLVANGYEDQRADGEGVTRMLQRTSSHTTPSGSRRWRRVFSDTESEDFDNLDSRYGETESNISFTQSRFWHGDTDANPFSAYGGESDASTDRRGFPDTGILVQPYGGSDLDIDTDIDPMRAGLSQWYSDEEDREWEETDAEDGRATRGIAGTQYRNYLASPSESYSSITRSQRFDSPEFERDIRQRTVESRQVLSRNINGFEDMDFSLHVANAGDYLDDRGFGELLEQLAESNNSRRGAPPASASFVRNLPRVIIHEEQLKDNDGLVCAICKDLFAIGSETIQLPCIHLYHTRCILPWLNAHNSCPLCRYELPTDDRDYEDGKHNAIGQRITDQDVIEDSSSGEDTEVEEGETTAETDPVHGERDESDSSVRRGSWLFLAAAPVVSLVGIVLAMVLSNSQRREMGSSHNQRGNRSRRWLPFS
ncbi:PREDICTED: uncharacterized protein LOC104816149 [Tarenaya hassleriana]|uniref:uncharacterized protein LOC104816149 n=1 Tax=Tarenaya hassleriana TaxID=28532 RepID=UPI00053C356F|nr:PREDICTED: uncharacterized protein LOC104816149 [Tarenaya hassleriana]XP_010543133.1 PREDICTED: uncharacterized protein LOC104816149 [Tarenaya hassleriana]XP_010543134.1 PREDICTED: uncharacterized protein LOC104816149 [Tarenaya hassleriana]